MNYYLFFIFSIVNRWKKKRLNVLNIVAVMRVDESRIFVSFGSVLPTLVFLHYQM